MPDRQEPSEADKLLAQVDAMLADHGGPAGVAATGGSRPPQRRRGAEPAPSPLRQHVRAALVSGTLAGGLVWMLFALLPFLRATSGGVGAFLGVSVAVLVLRRR